MRYTLRQMEVFLATAKQQSISKAAKQLAMSQSAASGALKDLEERYDLQLFDRLGKRLKLNEQGHALLPQVEQLLQHAAELEANLLGENQALALRIGATMTIGNYLAVNLMASFIEQYPVLDIKLHVANTNHIAQKILHFEVDIGLIEGQYIHKDLELMPWQSDELLVFCSPRHPYARRKKISDKMLCDARWILRENGSGTRQTFNHAMGDIVTDLDVHLELEHTEAIKRAVESDLGLGCLSAIALRPAIERGDIVALNTPQRPMKRQFYIALHRNKYRGKAIQAWVKHCDS